MSFFQNEHVKDINSTLSIIQIINLFQDDNGNMKTRYIIVTTEDMYKRTVVVEDKR